MPYIVTTIHDPVALAETCERLGLAAPADGCITLDGHEVAGLIVRLRGLFAPLVCKPLTGLIAYHPRDNVHERYRRIMHFIHRVYDVGAALRRKGRQESAYRTRGRRPFRSLATVAV